MYKFSMVNNTKNKVKNTNNKLKKTFALFVIYIYFHLI